MSFQVEILFKNCIRMIRLLRVLEFQTTCDITPAFLINGLSVACSIPVTDPGSGRIEAWGCQFPLAL